MFVRTKRNHSGTVSVQVIDKSSGSYKVIKTIVSSSDVEEKKGLKVLAREYIMNFEGQQTFSFDAPTDSSFFEAVYDSIRDVQMLGPEIVLGKIFDQIGFGAIPEDLFRHLVISRLIYPVSKLKTINYLQKYKGLSLHVNEVYRFMDRFHKGHMEQAKKISYEHTVSVLGDNFGMIFYDAPHCTLRLPMRMTTEYQGSARTASTAIPISCWVLWHANYTRSLSDN